MPTYYKRDTNPTNNNWNQANNWSTVSSTSAVNIGTFPSSATLDPVIFDANSIQVTVNVASACTSINFTGYTNTITMTFGITVSGNVTLGAGMTILGTGGLFIINANCTLTSNNKTWPNTLSLGGGAIFNATFADNWRVGSLVVPVSNGAVFLGNTIYVNGDVNLYLQRVGTTTDIVLDGTGDQTLTSSTVSGLPIESSITINKPSGKITFGATVTWRPKSGKTFKYITAGSYSTTGSTFYIYGGGTSGGVLDISGINLNDIRFNDSGVAINMTLASNVNVDGSLTSLGNGINLTGAYKILVKGDCLQTSGPFGNSGTFAGVELTGSNNQTLMLGGGGGTLPLATNLIIDKSGGVVTLGSTSTSTLFFGSSTATLTFINGTIDPRSTTFSTIAGTTYNIINSSGFSLNNWNPAVGTHTINTNPLVVNGTLLLAGNTTFAGTAVWTATNFTHAGAGFTCTLQAGNTYTVNGIFTMIGTAASRAILQSSDAVAVTANIASSSNQLFVTVGTLTPPAAGYVLGSTSTALPIALNNLLPDRPTIASGAASPYTLVSAIGVTALASGSYTLGKKAFLTVTNGTGSTNVAYVTTRDIDSNGGITIFASQSYTDAIGQPSANLFRTLNWGPLIAPSGSVYYTFVN